VAISGGHAFASTEAADGEDWQQSRLLHPSAGQRQREASGRVFIYDGLDYATVQQAMDEHFDRIDSMMFTGIRHPPTTPSGPVMVEEDGCD
jgi:hypothetical protein